MLEYGMQTVAQGNNLAQVQVPLNQMVAEAGAPTPAGLLAQARGGVVICQQMLDDLHKFADQFVGVRGEEKGANATSPVPNGNAEELRDSITHLSHRLNALCQRLSIL